MGDRANSEMNQALGRFRNGLKQKDNHVVTLQLALIGSFIVIVYLMILYWSAKQDQLFRVPPDLRQGVVMRANDVPPPTIFSFSYYILQQLNHWPDSGEKNFGENIYYLQAFLTPGFRAELTEELDQKANAGELRRRVRKIQEIIGRGFTHERVLIESDDSWVVWIDVEITETVHGKPVKTVYVQYGLRIVRYDVDPEKNPWGLAIAEYVGNPKLLQESDIAIPFRRPL